MAKALLGHMGSPQFRTADEVRRLRQRVKDLEAQLAKLEQENDALAAAARGPLLELDSVEHPALAGSAV